MNDSYSSAAVAAPAPQPFPMIHALLAYRRVVPAAAAVLLAALIAWFGFRTGLPDLYVVAAIAGVGIYGIVQIAIEVVALVAETLMPR
jgi:hypothetical protein